MATAISGNQKLYGYTPDPTPLITLSYFVNLYSMFGIFILGCGSTHLMEIWTLWNGTYRLAGVIKAIYCRGLCSDSGGAGAADSPSFASAQPVAIACRQPRTRKRKRGAPSRRSSA
jgi:hypothetical protein